MKLLSYLVLIAAVSLTACASKPSTSADAAPAPAAVASTQKASSQVATADLLGRGYAALRANRLEEAETLLQQARAQAPDDAYVLLNLGVVYQTKRQNKLAEQYYNDVIRLGGNAPLDAKDIAVLASSEVGVNSSPAIIARRNLTLIK